MQEKTPFDDPLQLFTQWFDEAKKAEPDATPMSLATATSEGQPSVRTVLLKSFDARGFVFYTNVRSRKGQELAQNPRAALCIFWPHLLKQVRIEGRVVQVSDEEADRYFASRPRHRQLAAWASEQSAPLASRQALLERYREMECKFADQPVPRPPFWSGYRVVPETIEFWIGHDDRLNERILFRKRGNGWERLLLNP